MRHTKTNYDKHIDLMYDADGNPTQLRRHVNSVLGKIVKGELSKKYIGGLRSEIKLAQADIVKANRMKKIANRKAQMPSVAKQQEMLRMGLDMYYRTIMRGIIQERGINERRQIKLQILGTRRLA